MLDVRGFKAVCYRVARGAGGSVREFRLAEGVAPSFHQVVIDFGDRPVAVVVDRFRPLVAVAEPRAIEFALARESGPLVFVDLPELVAALREVPALRVFSKAELDAPFRHADWPHVTEYDVQYWRPVTLGEAIFNYWDRAIGR